MSSQSAATLRSRYVTQAAADLEENRQLQQQLTERISVLKQEESLLLDILKLAEQYEGSGNASPLPEQRQDEPAAPKAAKAAAKTAQPPAANAGEAAKTAAQAGAKTDAKPDVKTDPKPDVKTDVKTGAKPDTKPGAKTGAKPDAKTGTKAGAKTGARKKPGQPLLSDLLTELLGRYEEPRLAKELRDELIEKHPDRDPTPQVVRNTLESLVAKGRIRRHKQQRSVMYTLVDQDSSG
ncbi:MULTISPECIES: hypothetical protein [unclassified Streptomyces]|uniref:hypothetical protein n=1 Tax=unclassified Streptomyces TaxID=2593676 RepID=UPI0036E1F6D7